MYINWCSWLAEAGRPGTSQGAKHAGGTPAAAARGAAAAALADKAGATTDPAAPAPASGDKKQQAAGIVAAGAAEPGASGWEAQIQKMFKVLFGSQEPLAVFLRETCEVTANFSNDFVDVSVLSTYYSMWLVHKRHKCLRALYAWRAATAARVGAARCSCCAVLLAM